MQSEFQCWLPAKWQKYIPIIAGTTITPATNFQQGFNLAKHIKDDPYRVQTHRQQLQTSTGLNQKWLWLNQIHSAKVAKEYQFSNQIIDADACIAEKNVAVVLTADCIPILLSNEQGTEFAAIHAGWQGLFKNIIAVTIANMKSDSEKLHAWIGPCIRQSYYEIDTQFYQRFMLLNSEYESFFIANRKQHYLADLSGIAQHQLRQTGLKSENITDSQLCSFSDSRFFSYRRDQQLSGRIATFIGPQN